MKQNWLYTKLFLNRMILKVQSVLKFKKIDKGKNKQQQLFDLIQWRSFCTYHFFRGSVVDIWAATSDFQQCGMCDQQRLRPACAYAQSDQSLIASRLNILWLISYWLNTSWSCNAYKMAVQARWSLHLSRSHIVGNHMPRLISVSLSCMLKKV